MSNSDIINPDLESNSTPNGQNTLKNSDVLGDLSRKVLELQEEVSSFKVEMKKIESRNIHVITFFVAIITFIFGSIQTSLFSGLIFWERIVIIILLGFILLFFTAAMSLFVGYDYLESSLKKVKNYTILLFFLSVFAFLGVFLLDVFKFMQTSNKDYTDKKIEDLQKIKNNSIVSTST
ncbi:MAG: hypothetical protein KAZ30_01775 [Candidatus Magasanikbacteria bacterium]|nr:hypothetical protein [Candidatus Magasanikbacteria bacterium]